MQKVWKGQKHRLLWLTELETWNLKIEYDMFTTVWISLRMQSMVIPENKVREAMKGMNSEPSGFDHGLGPDINKERYN